MFRDRPFVGAWGKTGYLRALRNLNCGGDACLEWRRGNFKGKPPINDLEVKGVGPGGRRLVGGGLAEPTPSAITPSTKAPGVERSVAAGPSLQTRWNTSRVPKIHTAEVSSSVAALFAYTKSIGLFSQSTHGMRQQTGIIDGQVDVMYAPGRRPAMRAQTHELKAGVSVLLDPPHPEQRGLSWRDYVVWPNIFPYFPPDMEHAVIAASTAAPQHFDARILSDMLDWQAAAGAGVTMIYNGMAGNSEDQLHWHSVRWCSPLQRSLDDGALATTVQKQTTEGAVSTFEDGFFGGLLLEGSRSFVAREAVTLVDALENRPPTQGKYNILLLPPKNDQVRLVLIARKAGVQHKERGAVNMAGMLLIQSDPPESAEAFAAHARQQLVEPSKLTWLNEVINQSRHPRLTTKK